ncbi:unnamed protein product [Toxocara canis]|uniref:Major sperm protein n=1 Tax=Toxocara canis TaxID=6265 RepID=A0A183UF58_TOXCA|nr:unnamed protein product [Toxocara canis]
MLDFLLEALCTFGPAAAFFVVLVVQCAGDSRPQHTNSKSGKGKKSKSGHSSKSKSSKSSKKKSRSSKGSARREDQKEKDTGSSKSSNQLANRSISGSQGERTPDSCRDGTDSKKDLRLEPVELRWGAKGGLQRVYIRNPTKERRAIKVKCSDNNLYRVNPVYSFVEPGHVLGIDVLRQLGEPKVDKMVFVTAKASAEDAHPRDIFESAEAKPMMVLPLIAVNE